MCIICDWKKLARTVLLAEVLPLRHVTCRDRCSGLSWHENRSCNSDPRLNILLLARLHDWARQEGTQWPATIREPFSTTAKGSRCIDPLPGSLPLPLQRARPATFQASQHFLIFFVSSHRLRKGFGDWRHHPALFAALGRDRIAGLKTPHIFRGLGPLQQWPQGLFRFLLKVQESQAKPPLPRLNSGKSGLFGGSSQPPCISHE